VTAAGTRRLAAALAASVLAHAALLSGGWLTPPREPEAPLPLLARLEPPPPAAAPAAVRPRMGQPAPRRATPPPAAPVIAPLPTAVPVADAAAAPAEAAAETPAVAPAAAAAPPAEPAQIATAPPSTFVSEPPPLSLPRKGRIAYTLYYGSDRSSVGRVVQRWEIDGDGYLLASEAETSGIVELFRPQRWRYLSRGRVTAHGLRPESFQMSRTRRGRTEEASARFDWDAGSLAFGAGGAVRSAALPAGSQDLASLLYQLALAPPPPGRFALAVTNGSRFETYEFEALPEETLHTPLGALRALPVRQLRRPGAESLEIWLATEYRHLPVRVRFIGRDGEPAGEQVATEIAVSEQ
jgi:hypothetical protein